MKIKVLYLGHIRCHQYHLIDIPDHEAYIRSPMWAMLIDHPQLGKVLVDTGNDPNFERTYSQGMKDTYPIPEVITIKDALAAEGLTPADIDMLLITHLHFDHTGGIQYFANTKAGANIIVTEPDAREAFYQTNLKPDGDGGAYLGVLFSKIPGIGYQPFDGEYKLADDLVLFTQKSHTPGVIGMRLTLPGAGTIICPSDTIYTAANYQENKPPGGTINKTSQEFYDNRERILQMQKEYDATVLFGHDYEQIREWAAKGWIE